jgi:hypothetical protein
MSPPDHRDLVIEDQAAELAMLREDVASFRALAHAAIGALREAVLEGDRRRAQLARLRADCRSLRAQVREAA